MTNMNTSKFMIAAGLISVSIATGYLSSAAQGLLAFGAGLLLIGLACWMINYLDGTKE